MKKTLKERLKSYLDKKEEELKGLEELKKSAINNENYSLAHNLDIKINSNSICIAELKSILYKY